MCRQEPWSAGSSPRARGTLIIGNHTLDVRRFIPACAGNILFRQKYVTAVPVHPRVRGEHRIAGIIRPKYIGSSPRARGTSNPARGICQCFRFIPACAGNITDDQGRDTVGSVHPRVRGEHNDINTGIRRDPGSSPRSRGTSFPVCLNCEILRFIPACAGNMVLDRFGIPHGVGSSPRARGTLRMSRQTEHAHRFIPACAGNIIGECADCGDKPVHPRVRGEHSLSSQNVIFQFGSSPRARGTYGYWRQSAPLDRFIPACAGNIRSRSLERCIPRGSSPRARGT